MNVSYFTVICEEIDMFDGKIIHISKKAKDLEEACQIVGSYIGQFPAAHWELYPCYIKI